jgi:two-component system, OmpR family, sensor histidine kinase KdpD
VQPPAKSAIVTSTYPPLRLLGARVAPITGRILGSLAAERLRPLHFLYGAVLVGLITIIGEAVTDYTSYLRPTHLALAYLLGVLIVAAWLGLWTALFAAALSVAVLDYLFVPPLYSFDISTPQDAVLLALFSVAALIASGLAARLREQVTIAENHAETTAALCRFAGKLSGTVTLNAAIQTVIDQVGTMLPHRASIVLTGDVPPSAPLTLPLRSSGETVGLLAVTPLEKTGSTDDQRRLLEALAELAGIAIGRQILADRLAQLGIEQAADRLRSALLNSIAHDLTAPIASVATALTSLSENYEAFDDQTRRELIAEAEHEAERLHQFSANLIHIARLETGVIELRRQPTDIGEVVGSALVRARNVLEPRRIVADIPADLPHISVDFVLIEQAVFHVLENAGKYTPPDTTVTITAGAENGGIALKIADEGPGFPAEDSERLFTKFFRSRYTSDSAGTGLGLAICRGFIEAHGGTISAMNRDDGSGALFTIGLPFAARAALADAQLTGPVR